MSDSTRIADALVLCLTRGMSLAAWRAGGVLAREWAIYARLAPVYGRIIVVSYGGLGEREIAAQLDAEVVCNEGGLEHERFVGLLPRLVREALKQHGAGSAVIKTNQMEGGDAAVAITRELRSAGLTAALIARGGYPWSRFEAWKHGPASVQAVRAAAEEGDLCRWADVVVGTSRSMVEDLSWRYQLPGERAALVPNYVMDEAFAITGIKRAPSKQPVMLSAGRLEEQKRFDLLIECVGVAAKLGAGPIKLRIVGEGPLQGALEAQAQKMKVDLELPGRMEHHTLLCEMAACTIYVQVSRYEGHPKTLIEAMATGAPVVVTDSPGLADPVEHPTGGIKVDFAGRALGDTLASMLRGGGPFGDLNRLDHIGRHAQSEARSRFSLGEVTNAELDVHRRAMTRARQSDTASPGMGTVRWDPTLLTADGKTRTLAWQQSISGFSRRLAASERAAFLFSLDDPIYQMQGRAAVEAEGGLHPKHRLMRYHDFFVERIKPSERVIDLGSGVGALAASIAEKCGATVTGIELSDENIAQASRIASERGVAGKVSYVKGDITANRASGAFDVIVLSNVLEHMKDRPALLRKWFEWYGASRILIRVPALDRDWKVPFKRELGVEWRLDDTHELEYTEAVLRAELAEAGLEATDLAARWGEYWLSARPVISAADWSRVKMLVLDFDGVMSNNQVLVMQDGTEGVLCNRSDGLGLELLRKKGLPVLVLSKEQNPVVGARCRKLKIECVQGIDDKKSELEKIARERGIALGDIAYVGNDTNDLPPMGIVGLPIAVADADPRCKAAARWVTTRPGGWLAVREVCERLMGVSVAG